MNKLKDYILPFLTKYTITDLQGLNDYLTRWSLWLPFGYSIKLHKIVRTDDDRCEHDHPWNFTRVILWGGYKENIHGIEHTRRPWRPWAFWRIYPCSARFQHRITELLNGQVSWTLVFAGPKNRHWGFYTLDGWKYWREFVGSKDKAQWCDDGRILQGKQ